MWSPTIPTSETDFFLIEEGLRAFPTQTPVDLDFTGRPVIAALYTISGLVMRILGPAYWAAIIILFVYAELFTN
jgi:hypothetical protein